MLILLFIFHWAVQTCQPVEGFLLLRTKWSAASSSHLGDTGPSPALPQTDRKHIFQNYKFVCFKKAIFKRKGSFARKLAGQKEVPWKIRKKLASAAERRLAVGKSSCIQSMFFRAKK